MDQKQFKELKWTIAGGALFMGGFLCGGIFMDTPWWRGGLLAGMLIVAVGLWMMLYPPLKRWWKSDRIQTWWDRIQAWWETGKTENDSGETSEDEKNEQ